ncbi:threonine synthase [Candidatus Micrarchaeota archaeon]|nr:threonine synthase [Candidatus Micrarchaeota archaeon]
MDYWLECIHCKATYSKEEIIYTCKKCKDILDVKYTYEDGSLDQARQGVWRYRNFLPIENGKKIVTLNEGNTTLFKCDNLAKVLGIRELYIKNEGENPTGSFKDRGMTVGVTKALEYGAKAVGCASTGNTSASLAAYSAKANLKCLIFIPSGKIAFGKLAQALVYGADVYTVQGNFDKAMELVTKLGKKGKIYLLNSINPYRTEGQKTLAYEIAEQLGEDNSIDRVFVPVGNAANINAIWKGFNEFLRFDYLEKLPRMFGVQAKGANPLARTFELNSKYKPIPKPETIATAIRIGNPISWKKATAAAKNSNGFIFSVTDDEILEAQALLAQKEGIFVEPASASSIAGLKKLVEDNEIGKDERIVCVTTGNGLKDPNVVVDNFKNKIKKIKDINKIKL